MLNFSKHRNVWYKGWIHLTVPELKALNTWMNSLLLVHSTVLEFHIIPSYTMDPLLVRLRTAGGNFTLQRVFYSRAEVFKNLAHDMDASVSCARFADDHVAQNVKPTPHCGSTIRIVICLLQTKLIREH